MNGTMAEWPRECRELPTQMQNEAADDSGGTVAGIDGSMVSDPNGCVLPEVITGV